MSQPRQGLGAGSTLTLLVAALFGFALALGAARDAEPRPGEIAHLRTPRRLTILHTNDLHGQLLPLDPDRPEQSGLVALGRRIRRERAEALADPGRGVLLLDAGDFFQGTIESDGSRGLALVEWFNALGFDAVTVGNHEFDFKAEAMAALAEEAKFPFLGANVRSTSTGQVPAWLGNRKGDPLDGRAIVRQIGSLRVAVIGVTSKSLDLHKQGDLDGIALTDEAEALESTLDRLSSVDVTIVLSHCGAHVDRALAERFQGRIDLIVAGHDHRELPAGERIGRVLIVQAGARARYLGRVDLEVLPPDQAGERPTVRAAAQILTPGDDLGELLRPHLERFAPTVQRVVAHLGDSGLSREIPPGEFSSPLGDLVADALLEEGHAELAFHNRGGTRANLPGGQVTFGALYEAFPFDNHLVTMNLSGAQIQEIVAASLSGAPLEISGASVEFNPSNPPAKRLLGIRFGSQPLDPVRIYRVALHHFLADGGDGHVGFKAGTEREDHALKLIDVVERYLGARHGYVPAAGRRWIRFGGGPDEGR